MRTMFSQVNRDGPSSAARWSRSWRDGAASSIVASDSSIIMTSTLAGASVTKGEGVGAIGSSDEDTRNGLAAWFCESPTAVSLASSEPFRPTLSRAQQERRSRRNSRWIERFESRHERVGWITRGSGIALSSPQAGPLSAYCSASTQALMPWMIGSLSPIAFIGCCGLPLPVGFRRIVL